MIKTLQILKNLAHPIYLDLEMNKTHVVLFNVYQSFLFVALKFGSYITQAFQGKSVHPNFLFQIIQEVAALEFILIQTRNNNRTLPLSRNQVIWLTLTAFKTILLKKFAKYKDVISLINEALAIKTMVQHQKYLKKYTKNDLHSHLLAVKY